MKMAQTFIIFFYRLLFYIGQVVNANEEDGKRWNKRYDTEEYMYGKEPIKLLKENINLLTKGKALVLAMGEERNAVFLAKNGFDVEGCDISEIAI
ncbi:MAG: hypothetical protein ACE5KZ_15995 [Candidatus Scalinduaceae bacterium]